MRAPPGYDRRMDLDTALRDLAQDASPAAQDALYGALIDGVVQVGVEDGAVLVERVADGRPAALLFSGDEPRARFAPGVDTVTLAGPDAFTTLVAAGVEAAVLDAAGPVRIELGSWELRRLAAREHPDPDAPPERDGQLAIEPARDRLDDAFLAELRAAAADDERIERLAVYEADPVRGRRHLVLAFETNGDPFDTSAALHTRLADRTPDDAVLNFALLTDDEPFRSTVDAATV
jgi:SseB protein N-terminal domain